MKRIVLLIAVAIASTVGYFGEANAATMTEGELKMTIELMDDELPADLGDGLVWQSAVYQGTYVKFTFKVDESDVTIAEMEPLKSMMKDMMMEALFSDPDSKVLLDALISLNKGITFDFIGSKTGKKLVITLTPSELKKL